MTPTATRSHALIVDRTTERVLALGAALALAGGLTLLSGHLVNHIVLDDRIFQLQASAEHNVWTWATSMATLTAALAVAVRATSRHRPSSDVVLVLLLAFFAMDDFVEAHERLGVWGSDALGLPDYVGPRLWVVLLLPILAFAFLLLWRAGRDIGGRFRRRLAAGLTLLVVGVFAEALGIATKRLEERGTEFPHALRAGLEESLELSGWILVATALLAAAIHGTSGPRAERDDSEPLRFANAPHA